MFDIFIKCVQENVQDQSQRNEKHDKEISNITIKVRSLSAKLNEVALKCGVETTSEDTIECQNHKTNVTVPAAIDSVRGMEVE